MKLALMNFLFVSLASFAYATCPQGSTHPGCSLTKESSPCPVGQHYSCSYGGHGENIGRMANSSLPFMTDLSCNLGNRSGDVYLSGVYHYQDKNGGEALQALKAWIGKETFADPYKVRNQCELVKGAIETVAGENWYFVGCEKSGSIFLSSGIYYKSLDFKISMSVTESKLGILRFFPYKTVTSGFTFSREEKVCDPL